MNSIKFDVVIVAKDVADTLGVCCKTIRVAHLNNLIIVVGKSRDSTREVAEKYGDIVVQDHNKGIGEAREVGLNNVKTDFFAFVDADVIVTPTWAKLCLNTIKLSDVGACEGIAYPTGKYCAMIVEESLASERGYCTLSSTMLKTEIVREVGIPHLYFGEDWELRRRIWDAGYRWIVNPDLKYIHLHTDWQGLRHRANFNSHTKIPAVKLLRILSGSPKCLLEKKYPLGRRIYNMLVILADSYGHVNAMGKHLS